MRELEIPLPAKTAVDHGTSVNAAPSCAAAARCRLYAQFAAAFLHPETGHEHQLCNGVWIDRFRDLARQLPYSDPFATARELSPGRATELDEIYSSTFDVGEGALSLYGRSYRKRNDNDKALFEELFRFYEHFGLKSEGGLPEYPDWLVIELEFMHYLSFLEAETDVPSLLVSLRRAEGDFIARHLLEFTAGLAATLTDHTVPLYADVAQLLNTFVSRDLAYLNEVAERT